jgi:hypothetical protein
MGQEQTLFANCRQERVGGSLGISVDVPGRLPPKDLSAEAGIHLNMYLVSRKATAMLESRSYYVWLSRGQGPKGVCTPSRTCESEINIYR